MSLDSEKTYRIENKKKPKRKSKKRRLNYSTKTHEIHIELKVPETGEVRYGVSVQKIGVGLTALYQADDFEDATRFAIKKQKQYGEK